MLRKYGVFLFSLIVTLFLYIGGNDIRLKRAQFLNNTAFLPYQFSLQTINKHFDLLDRNKILFKERNIYYLKSIELQNRLDQITHSELKFENDFSKTITAEVTGFTGNFIAKTLQINKGENHGIRVDDPVISSDGVLGKIISVAPNHSIFLPANHPQFKLGVLTQKNRVQGMLSNDLTGNTFMDMIPLNSQISIGDTVLTSNYSTIFPKSIPVGVIESINTSSNSLFLKANLELLSDTNNVEQVIIIKQKDENNG